MQRKICKTLALTAIAVAVLSGSFLAGTSIAQTVSEDISGVGYYQLFSGKDNPVRLINPTTQPISQGGFLCAMVYVFDEHEELQECCGCRVTNDGLRVISTAKDLVKNPLTNIALTRGGIEVVSALSNSSGSTGPACNPALTYSATPALRGFITHPGFYAPGAGEVALHDGNLGGAELSNLQSLCAFIHTNGTGRGICTCGVGDEIAPQPGAGGR